MVSTRGGSASEGEIERKLRESCGQVLRLDHSTPVPIKNLYSTPQTLGYDRLAAAVGACELHPGKTALVVDLGTAITFDVVTAAGEFLGGSISPGAGIRFRALHKFTGSLPLCELPAGDRAINTDYPPRDTKTAIQTGVTEGIVGEIERQISAAREKFGEIVIIFTGGDADYFASRLNFTIFAVSDLIFHGLNAILEHNASK